MNLTYKIKTHLLLLLMLLPTLLNAENGNDAAISLLDKAVEALRADAGVTMEFSYTAYDGNGDVLFTDKGTFCLDKKNPAHAVERYALLMQQLRVWNNGACQWNYMAQTNEIYITSADSEEAQNLSPLYLMQLYKSGQYKCSIEAGSQGSVVVLSSINDASEFSEIKVFLSAKTMRLVKLQMLTSDGNSAVIVVDGYKHGCTFGDAVFECPLNEYPDAEVIDMF